MVRVGKVACRFEDFIDELMHGKFFAIIESECMSFFSIGTQCRDDCCANCVCAFVFCFHQERSAASSISDGDENGTRLQTNDGVHLVVPKSGSVLDFFRSGTDTALSWDVTSSLARRVSFPVSADLVAQVRVKCAAGFFMSP